MELQSRDDRSLEENVYAAVTLYRLDATVNLPPLKLVSDSLQVSVSTATRLMTRARMAGLAEDLITRETYNRMRVEDARMSAPFQAPGGASGPAVGR